MLICPGCKSVLKQIPESGQCPTCGYTLREGVETKGHGEPTLGATQELGLPPTVLPDDTREPAVTQDPPRGAQRASLRAAPRKLSSKSVEKITNTWQRAVSRESNPQSSLKFDSQGASGGGSSLVVNPRRVRTPEAPVQPTTGGADYELLQVIGKGGMGVVYSARQASVDRMVAVKMIRSTAATNAERREKFLSEAVVTGDLDHPNIVPIYELGTDENDALFYSMKHVRGTPWSHVIGQKQLAENLEILMKVADAVAFAHANGVVHRDLKPENVMLGDFGEVLVMDWGLALATASFRHAEFVSRGDSMGGTPAYMAPEMVTGPFEQIGPACDIYLLGALLFEVVTRRRPHAGKTTQECLLAAARNEIQPTDKTGELVEIAYRAMATEPADRYPSVQEFQAAIRDYQSHMESITLAARAGGELDQARKSGDYQTFARALFGFEEAFALWSGNARARAGVSEARLAYAGSAKDKGDFELGISLLDPENVDHAPLRAALEAAHRERDARQKWLSRFKRIAAAMVVLVFAVISGALYLVAQAKDQETFAKQQAIDEAAAARKAERAAELARRQEQQQKDKAVAAEKVAQKERNTAREAEKAAKNAEAKAVEAKALEEKQKTAAIESEKKAVEAQHSEEQAAYLTRIGMAAAKIEENAFDTATSLLDECKPENLRNWEWGYLKRLCGQGRDFPVTGTVNAVAFSPDEAWFVTAGQDQQAHFWDRNSGQRLSPIDHPAAIQAVAVSPDSQFLATGARDGMVRIYRVKDRTRLHELKGDGNRVLDVAFSPDGRWLISTSASRDHSIRAWGTATGRQLDLPLARGHLGWVWSARFSPDGKRFVSAGEDGKVIVWPFDPDWAPSPEKKLYEPQRELLGHTGPVFAAAFSPDGQYVASGGYDKRVLIWEPDAIKDISLTRLVDLGKPIPPQASQALEGHSAPVRTLAFSPKGEYLMTGSDDNTVRFWDVVTGRPHTQLRGHSRPVLSCAISSDGRQVLSGGQEGQIKLWDVVNYKEAPHGRAFEGHNDAVQAAAFSRDGTHIVTASRDHSARVYKIDSGKLLVELREGHKFLATNAVYFDDGRRLLSAAGDNTARIWDAATGSELHVFPNTGRSAAIAVSRDAKWILTGRYVSTIGENRAPGEPLSAEKQDILRSSPQIAVWDLDADKKSARPHVFSKAAPGTGHAAIVTVVAISPDRRWLYSGDDAGLGKLWDAATGEEFKTLKSHTAEITGAVFLPDGRRLLTASKDGTVARWDVATGEELPPAIALAPPERRDAFDTPVIAIALARDGRRLLTLSEDFKAAGETSKEFIPARRQSVVRLWNVEDASLVSEFYRGDDGFTSIAYTDDGRGALAGGSRQRQQGEDGDPDGIVRRWDLTSGKEETAPGGAPYLDLAGRREVVWSAIEAPRGSGVLTVGGKGATLWNPARQPELLFKPHTGVTAAAFSADGKHVVTGSSDHRVKIWNTETGLAERQFPPEHGAPINSVCFSPTDPARVLTASSDGTARIWDVDKRQARFKLEHDPRDTQAGPVWAAIYSPDGKYVLSAGEDQTIRIWNADDGKLLHTVKVDSPVRSVACSPNGSRFLAGLGNGEAMIFDARTREPVMRYSGHTDAVNSVAFSPDGRRVLTGSRDRLAKIWDAGALEPIAAGGAKPPAPALAQAKGPQTGKELLTLRYHDQAVTSVAFSPDGRSVLTASLDGTAVLWLADEVPQAPALADAPAR